MIEETFRNEVQMHHSQGRKTVSNDKLTPETPHHEPIGSPQPETGVKLGKDAQSSADRRGQHDPDVQNEQIGSDDWEHVKVPPVQKAPDEQPSEGSQHDTDDQQPLMVGQWSEETSTKKHTWRAPAIIAIVGFAIGAFAAAGSRFIAMLFYAMLHAVPEVSPTGRIIMLPLFAGGMMFLFCVVSRAKKKLDWLDFMLGSTLISVIGIAILIAKQTVVTTRIDSSGYPTEYIRMLYPELGLHFIHGAIVGVLMLAFLLWLKSENAKSLIPLWAGLVGGMVAMTGFMLFYFLVVNPSALVGTTMGLCAITLYELTFCKLVRRCSPVEFARVLEQELHNGFQRVDTAFRQPSQ
ncbi:hypothetical protein [Seinonella peptonophila]|uniref:hypothetical protein n=1 Tax=Seinonella peptonophila TaxID=112248 RepID=UPI001114D371|nr:hypothetical protein [Seinonella peptonophila]